MRNIKNYGVVMIIMFFTLTSNAFSQSTITLGALENSGYSNSPIHSEGSIGWNREMFIYRQADIMPLLSANYSSEEEFNNIITAAITNKGGFYIRSLELYRLTDNLEVTPLTTHFKIFIRNTTANEFGDTAYWKEETESSLLVYDGDPANNIGSNRGFKLFNFKRPFFYRGGNIEIMFEFYRTATIENNKIDWAISTSMGGAYHYSSSNGFRITADNGSLPPNNSTFVTRQEEHPDIRLTYTTDISHQSITIGSGVGTDRNDNPIRSGTTGWNRNMFIYPASVLSGLKTESFINALAMYRMTDGTSIGTGNKLKIYLKNTPAYDYSFNGPTDWQSEITDAVKVFEGDPHDIVGSTTGYKKFPFVNSFLYTGENLEVLFEYIKTNDNNSDDAIEWSCSTTSGDMPSYDENQGMRYIVDDGSILNPASNTTFTDYAAKIPDILLEINNDPINILVSAPTTFGNKLIINNNENSRVYIINSTIKGETGQPSYTIDASDNNNAIVKSYLLLHECFKYVDASTLGISDHYVMGKISAIRGAAQSMDVSTNTPNNDGSWNLKWTADVNTASAYRTNRGSMVNYNAGCDSRLVTLDYLGTPYLAIELSEASSMFDFSFTGYAAKEKLVLVSEIKWDADNSIWIPNSSIQNVKDFVSSIDNNYIDAVNIQGGLEIKNAPQNFTSGTVKNTAAHLSFIASGQNLSGNSNPVDPYRWTFYTASKQGYNGVAANSFELWEYPSNPLTGTDATRPRLLIQESGSASAQPNPVIIKKDGSVCIGFGSDANSRNWSNIEGSVVYQLSVNGSIKAKKVKVSQLNWADFVFEKEHKLMPLTELEKYIKVNKHLPEVPTTKQVEKEGIDIGTTQALLLQKIEELTLYVIEQNKKIENQQKQINDLQKDKKIKKQ